MGNTEVGHAYGIPGAGAVSIGCEENRMKHRYDADVIFVGAGPSGCATALHLARQDVSVLVVDRQRFPRDKVCGEGLMPHGVRELDALGLLEKTREAGARSPSRGSPTTLASGARLGRSRRSRERDGGGLVSAGWSSMRCSSMQQAERTGSSFGPGPW